MVENKSKTVESKILGANYVGSDAAVCLSVPFFLRAGWKLVMYFRSGLTVT